MKYIKFGKYPLGIFVMILFGVHDTYSQSKTTFLEEPEIGRPCPPFKLDKVDFYNKNSVSLEDFKGKWLVLDFWAKNCSSCISGFPKVSEEQKALKDSVQFLMITYEDEEDQHRRMYANYHKNLNLQMPGAYDSNIVNQFNVGLLPFTIVIDPNSIVRAITPKVSLAKLKDLMGGGHPAFMPASYARAKTTGQPKTIYDKNIPFEVKENGAHDGDFIFRSLLSRWVPNNPMGYHKEMVHDLGEERRFHDQGRYEMLGAGLSNLYIAAYTGSTWIEGDSLEGNFWPKPILEIRDTSSFVKDYANGRNLYCYSMVVPPERATREYMMEIMQADLHHYFDYAAKVEVRSMPYWRLVSIGKESSELKSKEISGELNVDEKMPWQGGEYKNLPFRDFFGLVVAYFGLSSTEDPPLIDETGIQGNIDINVEWFKNDYTSIRKALRKNGLDLIEGRKEMKVLVIRDAK